MDTALLSLGVGFANLCIGVIVLIRGNGVKLARDFFVLSFMCGLWAAFDYLSASSKSAYFAWYYGGFRTVISYIAVVFLLKFVLMYIGKFSSFSKIAIGLLMSTSLGLTYIRFFTPLLVLEMVYRNGEFRIMPGPFYSVPVLVMFSLAILSAYFLLGYYRGHQTRESKAKVAIMLFGSFAAIITAIIAYGASPFIGIESTNIGVGAMGLFPLFIGLSILRYDLDTNLSFTAGSLRSKIFSAAMAATFFVIIPSLILLNVIFVRDITVRGSFQLNEDVIEKRAVITNYLSDITARAQTLAQSETDEMTSKRLQYEIEESKGTTSEILTLSIIDSSGRSIVSAYPHSRELESWVGDLSLRSAQLLGAYNSGTSMMLVVAAPIPSGVYAGYYFLIGFAPTDFYSATTEEAMSLFNTSKAYVLDKQGVLVTPYGSYTSFIGSSQNAPTRHVSCEEPLGSGSFTFSKYLDVRGIPVVGTGVPIANNGWCLMVEVDKEEIEATSRTMIVSTMAIGMLSVIFITLVAELLGALISKPIGQVKEGVARIMSGDFSTPVAVDTQDEIGELSRAFDEMTVELKDAQENITAKVRSQTQDLEEQRSDLLKQQKQMISLLSELEDEKERTDMLARDLEKFKQAADAANDHIVITDTEGRIIYANKSVKRITGFDPEEILGQKAGSRENWGGQMPLAFYKKLWKTIKVDKKPFKGEVTNKKKNGMPYTVVASISPVKDNKGNVLFFIGLERDISKEKEIDRAKSEFVSLASHQLRTPLSAINWYAEMLIDGDAGKLNKEQQQYVKEIYDGNRRMVDLVTALLNVSRLELGTFMVEPTLQSLQDLATQALKEMEPMRKAKQIKIHQQFDKCEPLMVDKKLMYIIFQNLISNALKYTPQKGEVTVSIQKKSKYINIKVADNGMGIPKEELPKLFEKLYRASNAKESATEGTGLGLYIVKAILDATEGKIDVDSTLGKGSVFTVKIPITGMNPKLGSKKLT